MPEMTESIQGLDSDMSSQSISSSLTIVSTDGVKYVLSREEASLSKVLLTSLEEEKQSVEIQVNVKSSTLDLILQFLRQHQGNPPPEIEKPIRSTTMSEITTEWCADYINQIAKNRMVLYDLVNSCNYLDIPSLLHLSCAKIASLVRGVKLDQIRQVLLEDEK